MEERGDDCGSKRCRAFEASSGGQYLGFPMGQGICRIVVIILYSSAGIESGG